MVAERQALAELRQSCLNMSEGIPLLEGQPALPDVKVLKKQLELLRKQDACLKMAISASVLQAQSSLS